MRTLRFFVVLVLLAGFLLPAAATAFDVCGPSDSHCHGLEIGASHSGTAHSHESSSEEPRSCDCPYHHAGCHHLSSFLFHEQSLSTLIREGQDLYHARSSVRVPSPDLEGIFQPPRA